MKNDSTFDIKLSAAPKITINDEEKTSNDYIASVTTEWVEGATNTGAVAVGNIFHRCFNNTSFRFKRSS